MHPLLGIEASLHAAVDRYDVGFNLAFDIGRLGDFYLTV
jgi:hypothetical protein